MSTDIAVALISSSSSIVVAVFSIIINNRLIGYKVDELKKQVEKHNGLVERVAILERDNKTAFNLIDDNKDEIRDIRTVIAK